MGKKPVDLPAVDLLRDIFRYDPHTGVLTKAADGSVAGRANRAGYLVVTAFGRPYLAHRVAWTMQHGPIAKGLIIDHVNGERADNRASNLRTVSYQENLWNQTVHKNNIIGHKGIYYEADRESYRVTVVRHGKQYRRRYKALADALAAYERFTVRHDGFLANDGEHAERADRVKRVAESFESWRGKKRAA